MVVITIQLITYQNYCPKLHMNLNENHLLLVCFEKPKYQQENKAVRHFKTDFEPRKDLN